MTGSMTMPVSAFFTLVTSSACSSMVRFLWMTPRPPSRAMQIAVRASVTVSMAEDRIGNGQGDARGQVRADIHILGDDVALGGNEQNIVEREGFAERTIRQHLGRLYICRARFKTFTHDARKSRRKPVRFGLTRLLSSWPVPNECY